MKFFFIPFFSALALNAFAQTSYVAPANVLGKGGYQFGASGEYFTSSSRIDRDGDEKEFENGEGFKRLQGEIFGHYGLTGNLQIGGGVRLRRNTFTTFDSAANENETSTTTGVESTYASFTYAFRPIEKFRWVLEGSYRFRPFTNEETKGTDIGSLVLGDDGPEYSAGLGVTYSSRNNYLTGRAGYRSPGLDLASEIYWQVEGALAWRYIALVAGVDGVTSMNNDPYTDDPASKPVFNTGSTNLYNSMNRQWVAPYAGINIALGQHWRVDFRGSQVVTGRSTDLGTAFSAALVRRVDTNKDKPDQKFKDYDFEASIKKVSPKKGYVVIDKGVSEDIQKGMRIDFYEFDYVGGNILLASGVVIQVKVDSSIVKITQLYNRKKELKEGVVARGSFR